MITTQGKRMALNRVPESLMQKTAPVQEVTIVDHCHGNLVQVQSLVNRTVDLLAMNVGRTVDSQIAPPAIQQGVSVVAPVNRVLTVDQLQQQVARAAFPVSVSEATSAHVPASQAPAAHTEPVRHTMSDPAYLPFINNS